MAVVITCLVVHVTAFSVQTSANYFAFSAATTFSCVRFLQETSTKSPTINVIKDNGIFIKMLYKPTQSVGFRAHPNFIHSNAVITDTGVQKLYRKYSYACQPSKHTAHNIKPNPTISVFSLIETHFS
jgi:hypothetical protein